MSTNSNQTKNEDNFELSAISEEQNSSIGQKPFYLSSPSTLPIQSNRKVSDAALESSDLFIQTTQRSKQSSQTLDETENKHSQGDSSDIFSLQNSSIQNEQQQIQDVLDKSIKSKESNLIKSQKDSIIQKTKKSLNDKKSSREKTKAKSYEKDLDTEQGEDNDNFDEETSSHQQASSNIVKKKKIRKACRFNYIEHYINHHQLSHRIETDEIIFENESFIPTNYQPNQYFNDNPISFFTLVNIHKRVQRTEHIFNNKKKNNGVVTTANKSSNNKSTSTTDQNSQLKQDQSQQQQQQHLKSTSATTTTQGNQNLNDSSIMKQSNKQNGKANSSAKKSNNSSQQQNQNSNSNNSNQLYKKKDYVNIYFEDRTHFQKSSLNQFIKKIKSLPGKGASLYSDAIEDFIQHKISLQKTVSYDLLQNFIDGLGNFYLLRVFKQTSTDLIIDHYTLSSSLVRLLGFETPTFCSYVTQHGVPYIHDVTGNYLQYLAHCMKSWVRSSENITIDATLVCADSLRIECSENIYTRTFHNAEKEEYYLVETHVFRPKKNDSKDYLLSDERISIFQSSFEPIKQNQTSQQSDQINIESINSNLKHMHNDVESKCENIDKNSLKLNKNGVLHGLNDNNLDANDFLQQILLNLAKDQTKIEYDSPNQNSVNDNNISNKKGQKPKKLNSKRKASESLLQINNKNEDSDDSEKRIQKKLCKYRLI